MLLYIVIPVVVIVVAIVTFIGVVLYLRGGMPPCDPQWRMDGKTVIVTGANAGIGYSVALEMASRGARTILACRNQHRAQQALNTIIDTTGNKDVVYVKLDLSSLRSVREFAAHIIDTEPQLDVLVNNAGVYGLVDLTEDGIVETMQINYLGHFLLTLLLLPLLKKSQSSRIINLSSNLHLLGNYTRSSLGTRNKLVSYCNSKFCMLLFAVELSRRLKDSGVAVNAAHPGVILTSITSEERTNALYRAAFWVWCAMYGRSAAEGARTVVYLALCPPSHLTSGQYFVDGKPTWRSYRINNHKKAEQLWEESITLVGLNEFSV